MVKGKLGPGPSTYNTNEESPEACSSPGFCSYCLNSCFCLSQFGSGFLSLAAEEPLMHKAKMILGTRKKKVSICGHLALWNALLKDKRRGVWEAFKVTSHEGVALGWKGRAGSELLYERRGVLQNDFCPEPHLD